MTEFFQSLGMTYEWAWFVATIAGILLIALPLMLAVAMIIYVDRKVWAAINLRRGPNVVGPFGLLQSFAGNATSAEFEITDTWARGPVVVNDRMDRFVLPNRTLEIPVVGVFYLVDGQIAEWTDFVFDFSV